MTATQQGTALITGASSGIGAVYADRLARRGFDLVLVARNGDRLQALATRLAADTGRKIETIAADLTNKKDIARVEAAIRTHRELTLLVNNAGVGATAPLLASDIEKMEEMIAINVNALTRLTYAAAPGFVARGAGTFINIASIVAVSPETLNGVYGGSKASCWRSASRCSTSWATRACACRPCCRARPPPSSGASRACRCSTCPRRSS